MIFARLVSHIIVGPFTLFISTCSCWNYIEFCNLVYLNFDIYWVTFPCCKRKHTLMTMIFHFSEGYGVWIIWLDMYPIGYFDFWNVIHCYRVGFLSCPYCSKFILFQERKKIIKGMKGHVGKVAHDQYGSMVRTANGCLFFHLLSSIFF